MVTLQFPIVFNFGLMGLLLAWTTSCASARSDSVEAMVRGEAQISYPFYVHTPQLGTAGDHDRFVIRTVSGNTEYTVEVPSAAEDFDVMIPLAETQQQVSLEEKMLKTARNAQLTDRELTAQFPKPDAKTLKDRQLLDDAFGVSEKTGPRQAPSYSLGLAQLGQMYQRQEFELCLIEINHLLAFYPNAPRLHKMKGSVLLKLNNPRLALKAWYRASELTPEDRVVQKGIRNLTAKLQVLDGKAP